jgi:trans-2,3-dihydro-3-hydroxyanthranilate isomerase
VQANGQAAPARSDRLDYVVCDVFTSAPLAGNALAVFPATVGLAPDLRQRLAREMNLSETVFVTPAEAGGDGRLQIHTPDRELPFAGHPLLGSAAVLADCSDADLRLETGVGRVAVEVRALGRNRASAWMVQPWPRAVEVDGKLVADALGMGRDLTVVGYDNGVRFAFVELGEAAKLSALRLDLGLLGGLGHGLYCFAPAGERWRSRMFGPAIGVPEDPATGSGAGSLAVHLHSQGRIQTGERMLIEQGAEVGRPSLLEAIVEADGRGEKQVRVGGNVVVVAKGSFELPSAP